MAPTKKVKKSAENIVSFNAMVRAAVADHSSVS